MDLLTFHLCCFISTNNFCFCPDSGCEGGSKNIEDILPTWTLYTGPSDQGWGVSWHILRSMVRREMGDWDGTTSEEGSPLSQGSHSGPGYWSYASWSLVPSWSQTQSLLSDISNAFFKMYLHFIVMCFRLKICLDALKLEFCHISKRVQNKLVTSFLIEELYSKL